MKRLFTPLIAVFMTVCVCAQSPQKMNYQAVIRDNSDRLVTSHAVGIKITILQGSPTGTAVYAETQIPSTNANGLISIEIGGEAGFSSIDWSTGTYFLKTEVDPAGGTSYSIMGTSQLLSVPFAMHAKTVEELPEADPVFTSWDKDYADLINKPTAISDFTLNANSQKITGLAGPVNATDAATKSYVDALLNRIETLEVLTYGFFTDSRDGNQYNAVKIGNQIWMAENLAYLPVVHSNSEYETQGNNYQPGYGVYGYDGSDIATAKSQTNYTTYGVLYNGYTVTSVNICPAGWHVPNYAEWLTLITYVGGYDVAGPGGKLKETGTTHWLSPNTGATNETGFTALPGGNRSFDGSFVNIGTKGSFWSISEFDASNRWYSYLSYNSGVVRTIPDNKKYGLSVRCIKD